MAHLSILPNVHQNSLSHKVHHMGLAPADQLTLGDVKVWGVGRQAITRVTLSRTGVPDDSLLFSHNVSTEVSSKQTALNDKKT